MAWTSRHTGGASSGDLALDFVEKVKALTVTVDFNREEVPLMPFDTRVVIILCLNECVAKDGVLFPAL